MTQDENMTQDQPEFAPDEAAETTTPGADEPKRGLWQSLTYFRGSRPFWGSLLLMLGGWFVIQPVVGSFSMMAGLGSGGGAVYIIGGGMMAAALISFFMPKQRHFPAIMGAILSVASLPLANLGGWVIGALCGMIGAGLIFAWTPYTDEELERFAQRRARRRERREGRGTKVDRAIA